MILDTFERDNYQCRTCGVTGENILHEHHVLYRSHGGPEDAWNKITLCWRCHRRFHDHPEELKVMVDETGFPHVYVRRNK